MANQKNTSFNTANPDHITYEHPPLEITVLGGIRLEGLDRMRATLKIKSEEQQAIRHNLDLYNNIQVEKLVRRVAERLETGTSIVNEALASLTEALEDYRMHEIERIASAGHNQKKYLTPEETKAAELYLSAPNLMQRTMEDIGRAGVIGEENNRLLMYLIFTSRKRTSPLQVISLGSSGIGKTHLQETVGALIPEEDKLEITTLSGNAFYYFGQHELKNKLILIEDLDGAEDVLYPLREIISKKKVTKTVVVKNTRGETKTITLKVEGPVCVAGCTTRESIYEDNANRSFLIYIDESKEQDRKIMDYQRADSAGRIDKAAQRHIAELLKDTQRILKPVQVRNPYAESLHIPEEVFKPRRTNAHYLAFIEAVTFYHQYQREKQYDKETGEEYIETTLEDIEAANHLMQEVLLRKSDELNGATRSYFEQLKRWLTEEDKNSFTNISARQALRVNASNQKRYMIALQEWGLVRKIKGDKKNGYAYEVTSHEDQHQRTKKIQSILDEIVTTLKTQQTKGKQTKKPERSSK
ncbi:hypothetical protein JMN32_10590 [Fulvivirga sp. 29W222]|uniref:DNA primase n=1 Tax=Fulvivirga marina TaxID=2494733 RepID=A0A937KBD8_9BACT|nr:hypothetical protein [Fulvivirga marina]MBL6446761.1 hypothetical protein [Fulvivirga marina]